MKKWLKTLLLLGGVTMTLTACGQNSDKPENAYTSTNADGYTVVYPTPVKGALHNPGMGWISLEEQTDIGKMDLGKNGLLPEIDNIGIQTSWALIEKKPGVFDWSLIDQAIDYWTGQGKRINFRICTDSLNLPEVFYGAPTWLNEAPYNVDFEEYSYSGAAKARVNDLTDPTYKEYFERFMAKLSERYVDNPYLDTVDIRGYGMWGEWHSGHSFATMEERMFTLAYIVDIYAQKFAKNGITLFLSNSWDYQGSNEDGSSASTQGNCAYEDYLIWSALDHAMSLEYVGYRRDGMSGNGVTKYSTDEKLLAELIESGKKVSNCGEFFSGFQSYIDNLYGMNPVEAVDELLFKSRCNYATAMGWVNIEVANIVEAGYEEVFNRGNEKMGYRLKVDKARFKSENAPGETITLMTQFSNSGVGRLTLTDHKVAIFLIDSANRIQQRYVNEAYDLRLLLNGEIGNVYNTIKLRDDLAKGDYTVAIAIVDENNNPALRLSQVGNYQTKIYPLGTMKVGNKTKASNSFTALEEGKLKDFRFRANSHYEVTFSYAPSFALEDYTLGDTNGFVAKLSSAKGGSAADLTVASFKDVSGEQAIKTIAFSTGNQDDYSLDIFGTGAYSGKIAIGSSIVEERTGYLARFEGNYDLLSTKSPWYSNSYEPEMIQEGSLRGDQSVLLKSEARHASKDLLLSDPNLLPLAGNASYSLSFLTKGHQVGGNGTYYYLAIVDGQGNKTIVGEWYDRPDQAASFKTFTFTVPAAEGSSLAFGIKNQGAFLVDNINLIENEKGLRIEGEDILDINNVRPVDTAKGLGSTEGFENMVLNDCVFSYGFNRWGNLTIDPSEVITGQSSLSTRLVDAIYTTNPDNNWFEFAYSNPKYLKFEANTSYRLRFSYKVIDPIYLNTDPTTRGYGYFIARSGSGAPDTPVQTFATSNIETGVVKTAIFNFTTGNASDYKLVLGMFGRGIVIIDDIVVTQR